MKKVSLLILGCLVAAVTFAQSSDTRNLDSFTKVSAQEGINVYLRAGSSEKAKIEVSGIDINEVRTDVDNGTLKIHLEDDNYRRNVEVKVVVTYRQLSALRASSAASIEVEDDVNADGDFDIRCSSAGDIKLTLTAEDVDIDVSSSGDVDLVVDADDIDANVSSSGDINIEGTADAVDVRASSAGDFDGYDLQVRSADLRASSGASIKIEVSETLEARASSGGSIRYKGSPRNTDSNSSSGGSVKKA